MLYPNDSSINIIKKTADQNAALLLPRPEIRHEGVTEEEAAPPVQSGNNNSNNNTNNPEVIVMEENIEEVFKNLLTTHGMEGYVPWSRVLIFDAGFGGANMAMALGKLRIGVIIGIKQAYALFLKNEIESQMKDVPSGLWVILESVVDGVDLLAIG